MKRLIRIALTTLLASSLLAGPAAADPRGDRGGRGWERREARGDREYRGQREYRGPARERGERGGPDWRRDRYEPGDRRGRRWDDGDRGPYPGPPAYSRSQPPGGYGLRRGGMAPPSYRGAIVPDYGRHRLRPPPPGFAWVRAGDRYLLISRSTGQIFDVIGD